MRASLVRAQLFTICVGLQSRQVAALELLTIADASVGLARFVPMHVKWSIKCAVLHYSIHDV
jgi:hypothetical protein